jgi:hypothetical protein
LRISLFVFAVLIGCATTSHHTIPNQISDKKTIEWLEARQKKVKPSALNFTDATLRSGITFKNQSTPDAGISFKGNHYDHGNGLAAADVNADGNIDLFFPSQVGGGELWLNQGDGTFKDFTASSDIKLKNKTVISASFADVDNDGDADLFITTIKDGNILLANDGQAHFKDISVSSGTNYSGHSSSSLFFDYNQDGLLDILVTQTGIFTGNKRGENNYCIGLYAAFGNHLDPEKFERPLLYQNLGNLKFKEVAIEVGLTPKVWGGDAFITDINQDRRPDIYFLNMQGNDAFYINLPKGFKEVTKSYFPKTPWGSMGGAVMDLNHDGKLDLYVTDMHSDMFKVLDVSEEAQENKKNPINPKLEILQDGSDNLFGNAFYLSTKNKQRKESSDDLGLENYWPWGVSRGDFNTDGDVDFFVTGGMGVDHRYGANFLLIQEKGKFIDQALVSGIEPRANQLTHQKWFELDCQNWDQLNLVCATCFNEQKEMVNTQEKKIQVGGYDPRLCYDITRLSQKENGKTIIYEPISSRSSVVIDLDHDGDLDIVTNNFNAAPQVLLNNSQLDGKKQIAVFLEGSRSNRDALGSFVTVIRKSGKNFNYWFDGKSGYLSQSRLPLYLADDVMDPILNIKILWSSGSTQLVTRPSDSIWKIKEAIN